ncbi:MAG: SPFH domain-containing protein [Clostridia bacterium]|nr:SPFH domain-containing protein [Clostridia bacterium]
MGLLKAGVGALGGVMADQWREFFYCDSLSSNVLMTKGQKRTSQRSSNTKGSDNIITNGSIITVADGQCMIIVDQGKVVEVCAEPGEFVYDSSTEPSIFSGNLGDSIKETFKTVGKRFTFGGDTGKDQRVYYFNTKQIMGNKFGTPNPFMFDVVNKEVGIRRTVQVRCNGTYTYKITDPLLFYKEVCGNVTSEFTREEIDSALKTEFIDALQPAFAILTELQLRPSQIPAHTKELKDAINTTLKSSWSESRGITVENIALNPITLTEEDMKKINQLEDAASLGSNPFMMAGRMADSTANAMEAAASNPNGAMNGFIGMGMAMNQGGMGNGFGAAQGFYNMGVQQQQQQMQQQQASPAQTDGWKCSCGATATGKFCLNCGAKKPEPQQADSWKCSCGADATGKFCPNCGSQKPQADGWTCSCGSVNKGMFCPNCGSKKPAGAPLYRCDKCGWEPADPHNPPRFCPECGDPFDEKDIK